MLNSSKKPLEEYVYKNQKKLRCGYTTGSCAAAAAKASCFMLICEKELSNVELMTPKGVVLSLEVLNKERSKESVCCAIRKDSGDDPDATNGILVYAKVSRKNTSEREEALMQEGNLQQKNKIIIDGGVGVGRITKPGLEQPIGAAAINQVPRSMIEKEVRQICEDYEYPYDIFVEISIPEGVEIAKKTFNPRLGILGGISILGTSGIVEPMSEQAILDTIYLEMKMLSKKRQSYLLVTPGNYGEAFLQEHLQLDINSSVKCSNFIGETIDFSVELGFQGILLIGHIGKFIKLAAGIMNTHSKQADARLEIITAHAALAGASYEIVKELMQCITTDEAVLVLKENHLLHSVMGSVLEKISFYLENRAGDTLKIGAILYSNQYGILGKTKEAEFLLSQIK